MESLEKPKSTDTSQHSLYRRVGWQAACTLIGAALASLAVVGFLAFLWFADLNSSVWYRIMINGWTTRAVSISTLILRTAIDLQAGVAAAMLASIVLESSSVYLRDAAKVSAMRASSPQPRALLELIPAMNKWTFAVFDSAALAGYSSAVLLLFFTTTILQFGSTVLLSDLHLGQLPSLPTNHTSTYDFVYTTHGQALSSNVSSGPSYGYSRYTGPVTYPIQLRVPTWSRNPPAFPAFAEYSKPISSSVGVDDTGVLLRAFLPVPEAQSRETIRNYSGVAHILDSRVSCQGPRLINVSAKPANFYYPGLTGPVPGRLNGTLEPSVRDVERLWTPRPIPFDCGTFMNVDSLSICQVGFSGESSFYPDSGSLLSEFWNITQNDTRNANKEGGLSLYSLPMLVVQSHKSAGGDLKQKITGFQHSGSSTIISTPATSWTVSLCYSAWDTADLEVDIYSNRNRSEPITHWSASQGYFTVPDVHYQMGENQNRKTSIESRGILQLAQKSSWVPEPQYAIPNAVKPFVQEFADLNEDANLQNILPYSCSPCSALLASSDSSLTWSYDHNRMFLVDYTLTALFQQALGKNGTGSVAWAMSSLITTLSSMAYYDQMAQFERNSNSTQAFFSTVLFPQSRLGFWLVAVILAVHRGLVSLIALGFVIISKHTLLGNHWQSIAQLQAPETEDLIAKTRMATDGEVKTALKVADYEDVRVGIRSLESGRKAGLRAVQQRDQTNWS